MNYKSEYTIFTHQILMIGDLGVGKTSLLKCYKKFEDKITPTRGVVFYVLDHELTNPCHKFNLWDFSGKTRHNERNVFYQNSSHYSTVIIFVFDLSNKSSLKRISEILEEDQHELPKCPMILVGTKSDLKAARQVTFEKAKHFAKKHDLTYIETSAVADINVSLLFEHVKRVAKESTNSTLAEGEDNSSSVDSYLYSEGSDSGSFEEETAQAENKALKALTNYVDILSKLDEKSCSKNNIIAGKAKAKYLLKNLLNDEETPAESKVKSILQHNYAKVLDNRSRLGIKLYKIYSLFFGCRNEFQHDRLCESRTEELLVKYYNSLQI